MQIQIHIEENKKEIKAHGDYHFPVNVSEESITQYEGGAFLWHWHPEIELTWIQKGQMEYYVNEKRYFLEEGEGLFSNSNALHSGYMKDGCPCEYLSVTFHPRFIYGYESSLLQSKYMDFITSNAEWSSLKLIPSVQWQMEIIESLKKIHALSKSKPFDYELELHIILSGIWQKLYLYYLSLPKKEQPSEGRWQRLKIIMTYIQEHYFEPLTLEEIAGSVNICKSECCRFFKKHMNMTLFEYLMFYRIQQSLSLLKEGESITKAAGMVGFSDPCYYGKIFRRYMNCSPSQYKKSSAME